MDEETLRAHRTPWNTFGGLQGGAACAALEFGQPQDWSAYNRISLWVYIHPSRNPNVSFALDLTDEGLVQKQSVLPASWKKLTLKGIGPERKTYTVYGKAGK